MFGKCLAGLKKALILNCSKVQKNQIMASVNFRLRSNANKNVAIKVYLSTGRNNLIELNTGFTINPKNWIVSEKSTNHRNKIQTKINYYLTNSKS